jgi:hypothetical protein
MYYIPNIICQIPNIIPPPSGRSLLPHHQYLLLSLVSSTCISSPSPHHSVAYPEHGVTHPEHLHILLRMFSDDAPAPNIITNTGIPTQTQLESLRSLYPERCAAYPEPSVACPKPNRPSDVRSHSIQTLSPIPSTSPTPQQLQIHNISRTITAHPEQSRASTCLGHLQSLRPDIEPNILLEFHTTRRGLLIRVSHISRTFTAHPEQLHSIPYVQR